jgi:hypothetical protein
MMAIEARQNKTKPDDCIEREKRMKLINNLLIRLPFSQTCLHI